MKQIGAFTWAGFETAFNRERTRGRLPDRRRGEERRFTETAYTYAVEIADRAVENGVSEEDFIGKLIALSPAHKEKCRQIYREVKNARISRE